MIEFHAGTGPDTQAVGIALEEMFLDYRIMPVRAPLPVIAIGGARVAGASNVLMALARKTGRFAPKTEDATRWLQTTEPDADALDALLATSTFIAAEVSVADMALYPRFAVRHSGAHGGIARWVAAMARRPAVGRGMGVVAPAPTSGR